MANTINIINNFSPILALKAYFIKKCFDAGLNSSSSPSDIPHIEISRNLTTSIPGFNSEKVVSWENKFLPNSDIFIVIVKIDSHYTIFKIRNKNGSDVSNEKLATEVQIRENTYIYPTAIIYESFSSVYSYNILNFSDWVDASTLTTDNREALNLAMLCGYKLPNIVPQEDNVYGYIFVNEGILPTPDRVAYHCSNRIVGMEILYRSFNSSKKITKQTVDKPKINVSDSEEE